MTKEIAEDLPSASDDPDGAPPIAAEKRGCTDA
jgi:hypothetical protein